MSGFCFNEACELSQPVILETNCVLTVWLLATTIHTAHVEVTMLSWPEGHLPTSACSTSSSTSRHHKPFTCRQETRSAPLCDLDLDLMLLPHSSLSHSGIFCPFCPAGCVRCSREIPAVRSTSGGSCREGVRLRQLQRLGSKGPLSAGEHH